ncbi:hypothetical protein D3C77_406190 [compost metagenome]
MQSREDSRQLAIAAHGEQHARNTYLHGQGIAESHDHGDQPGDRNRTPWAHLNREQLIDRTRGIVDGNTLHQVPQDPCSDDEEQAADTQDPQDCSPNELAVITLDLFGQRRNRVETQE